MQIGKLIKERLELAPEFALNGSGLRFKDTGSMAGTLGGEYYHITIGGSTHTCHKIVAYLSKLEGYHLLKQGYVLDHKDENKLHNAPENLRVVTKRYNTIRSMSPNQLGQRNIRFTGNYYSVRVMVQGKQICKGGFTTLEQAISERDKLLSQSA